MSRISRSLNVAMPLIAILGFAAANVLALADEGHLEPYTGLRSEAVVQNDLRVLGLPSGTINMQGNVARAHIRVQDERAEVEINRVTGAFRVIQASPQLRQAINNQIAVSSLRQLDSGAITPQIIDTLPGGLGTQGTCESRVQGKVAWDGSGDKQWPTQLVARLCANASDSEEPGVCYERLMSGTINWGGGTKWQPANAVNLCMGSRDARKTIACFKDAIQGGQTWQNAIDKCN